MLKRKLSGRKCHINWRPLYNDNLWWGKNIWKFRTHIAAAKIQFFPELTCTTKVPIQMEQNIGFVNTPLNTFRWPLILRALNSLNKVIITNVLNITVKCCDGGWPWPDSISSNVSPVNKSQVFKVYRYIIYSKQLSIFFKIVIISSTKTYNRNTTQNIRSFLASKN